MVTANVLVVVGVLFVLVLLIIRLLLLVVMVLTFLALRVVAITVALNVSVARDVSEVVPDWAELVLHDERVGVVAVVLEPVMLASRLLIITFVVAVPCAFVFAVVVGTATVVVVVPVTLRREILNVQMPVWLSGS